MHPADGPIGQVLGQVVTLFWSPGRLHGRRTVMKRRIPLIVLATDETVPRGSRTHHHPEGHASKGPSGEDCQTGTSWHLPNWAVEYPLSFRVIANGAFVLGRNELLPGAEVAVSVMLPMPTEWWLRPGEERLASGRAQCGGVEALVPQTPGGEPVGRRRASGPPNLLEAPKPTSSRRIDQHIWCTLWWNQGLDRQYEVCGSLAS